MQPITSFQGRYRFLSNFWPCHIEYKGLIYPTLEHAYVAAKITDPAIQLAVRDCATPGEAKGYLKAHAVKRDIEWTRATKLAVMENLLLIKFGGKEPLLTMALMKTEGAELIEGNDWNDTFWGICGIEGENHLGKLLMKIRNQLFSEKHFIESQVAAAATYQQLANATGFSIPVLYEKMMAFEMPQNKYLGY